MDLKYTRALLPGMFLDYDCVIIPGLGGFVCNERSAWYDEERAEMVPPSRDVLFSPNLIHNDGLLAQEIMRATDCSYSDAMSFVDSEAAMMVEELSNGAPVELPRVGRLYQGEDGVIRFLPDAEMVRTLSSFGHSRIPLTQLNAEAVLELETQDSTLENEPTIVLPISDSPTEEDSKKQERKDRETKVIPLRVKIARVAAIIAIPFMLGGAWMLTDPTPSTTLMSVLPTFTPSTESLLFVSSEEEKAEEVLVSNYAPNEELVAIEPPVEIIAPVEEETPVEVVAPMEINFLIVGGAFSVKENALTLVSILEGEGYTPTIHFQRHNRLHLVALGEFETEGSARRGLKKARKSGRKATWLKKM